MIYKFFVGIIATAALAGEASAFSIAPARMLVTIDPGQTQTVVVKIKNDDSIKKTYKLSVLGIRQDENGRPIFERQVDEAENWVYPEIGQITLKSSETKNVNFFIKAPADAQPGSHFLGLAVDQFGSKDEPNNLAGRLVSILKLQVSGIVKESVKIKKWQLSERKNGKYYFDLELLNNGTVDVALEGVVNVTNLSGRELLSVDVDLGNKLLVGSARNLMVEVDKADNFGINSVQLKINYGQLGQKISSSEKIWNLNIWPFAILVFVSVISVIFFKRKTLQKQ